MAVQATGCVGPGHLRNLGPRPRRTWRHLLGLWKLRLLQLRLQDDITWFLCKCDSGNAKINKTGPGKVLSRGPGGRSPREYTNGFRVMSPSGVV
eukprot:5072437-Amphidinium_carterae.1